MTAPVLTVTRPEAIPAAAVTRTAAVGSWPNRDGLGVIEVISVTVLGTPRYTENGDDVAGPHAAKFSTAKVPVIVCGPSVSSG
jgi:hypothetical protein